MGSSSRSFNDRIQTMEKKLEFKTVPDPGDAGAISITGSGVCSIVTGGVETRTLAAPRFAGQFLVLWHQTDGGSVAVTCGTTFDEAGNNTYTSVDDGDHIFLLGTDDNGTLKWRVGSGGLAAGVFSDLSTV